MNHFFLPPVVFFWAFWAALSWAFCWDCLSLFTGFLSPDFLAARALFLYLISRTASSARAFLSSGLAFFIFLMSSRVTPSIALYFLKILFLLFLPVSVCFNFLWRRLHAVVHLSLWALSFLDVDGSTSMRSLWFFCWGRGKVCRLWRRIWYLFRDRFSTRWRRRVRFWWPWLVMIKKCN